MLRRECRRRSRPPRTQVPRSRRVNTSSHVARTSTASMGGSSSVARSPWPGPTRIARSSMWTARRARDAAQHHPDLAVEHTWCGPRRDPVGAASRSGPSRSSAGCSSTITGRTFSRTTGQAARYAMAPSTCSTRPMASHSEHGVGFASWSGPRSSSWLAGSRGPRCTSRRSRARSRAHQPLLASSDHPMRAHATKGLELPRGASRAAAVIETSSSRRWSSSSVR